ncbi:hypothetical protein CMV_024781 [Castanea mollissima]|uniref:Uncharacterized protein n=1 Tax=Castanea mollissima TaxID=60419 RepID=A0A8J4QHE4_9ROSI|nr:hypothetical protein CMV_024781 [Castanea mollissima]
MKSGEYNLQKNTEARHFVEYGPERNTCILILGSERAGFNFHSQAVSLPAHILSHRKKRGASMLATIFSNLIFTKKMKVMQLISPGVSKFWNLLEIPHSGST